MKIRYLLLLLVPFLVSLDLPENLLKELKEIKESFNYEVATMNLKYNVYKQSDGKLLESKTAYYECSANNYLYELDNIKMIQNTEWNVYIDSKDKIVIVKEATINTGEEFMKFDVAINGIESVSKKEINGLFSYSLKFKDPVSKIYSQMQVYTSKSLQPKKIVMDYAYETEHVKSNGDVINDKLRFEILYKSIKKVSKSSFKTSHILEKESEDFKLIGDYSNYKLFDLRLHK